MADSILLILAFIDDTPIAGALNFIGSEALYGLLGRGGGQAARGRDPEGGRGDAARRASSRRARGRTMPLGPMTQPRPNDAGPGVPEALPRTLQKIAAQIGVERIDRLWIFPPLIRGRREQGLVAVSVFGAAPDSRSLHSVAYTAERTGQGLSVNQSFTEQGDAPPDRLPRVMDGVVRRARDELGEPREIVLDGKPDAFEELMAEFDAALLEPSPASGAPAASEIASS